MAESQFANGNQYERLGVQSKLSEVREHHVISETCDPHTTRDLSYLCQDRCKTLLSLWPPLCQHPKGFETRIQKHMICSRAPSI